MSSNWYWASKSQKLLTKMLLNRFHEKYEAWQFVYHQFNLPNSSTFHFRNFGWRAEGGARQTIEIISIDAINNNSVSFQPIHFSFQAKIMIFITALRAHLVPTYLCNSLSLILFLSPTLLCLTHTHIYLPRYLHTPGYKLYPYLSHTTCVRLSLKHTHTHTHTLSCSLSRQGLMFSHLKGQSSRNFSFGRNNADHRWPDSTNHVHL